VAMTTLEARRRAGSGGAMPRVVVVTRKTDYERVVDRHGTRAQARFFLASRGQDLEEAQSRHDRFQRALRHVVGSIPLSWRRANVRRAELDRFLFEPADTIVVVGQDGLVANAAKYLDGQSVIGVNPVPGYFEGVLVNHTPGDVAELLPATVYGEAERELRTMARVTLDDGQALCALNEVFVGHRTHQSARYRITFGQQTERHSSSGLIITTGTGATGWAKSITRQHREPPLLPSPTDHWLTFLVREPWPSVATGTALAGGVVAPETPLTLVSELNDGGVIFGDGIESDCLAFRWGLSATIAPAEKKLALIRT